MVKKPVVGDTEVPVPNDYNGLPAHTCLYGPIDIIRLSREPPTPGQVAG